MPPRSNKTAGLTGDTALMMNKGINSFSHNGIKSELGITGCSPTYQTEYTNKVHTIRLLMEFLSIYYGFSYVN